MVQNPCEVNFILESNLRACYTELTNLMELEWATQRIINMYLVWQRQLIDILKRFGMRSVKELVGRLDLIAHVDYTKPEDVDGELD